jgi:hypothetical protein
VRVDTLSLQKAFIMTREEQNRIAYYIACIGAFAKKFSISNAFAYNYLLRYRALDFIFEHYEIEHTLSLDDAVEDMYTISKRNGGPLA